MLSSIFKAQKEEKKRERERDIVNMKESKA